jgi:cytosine/adenosine deaminase-related metal-dependent hydrolase
MIFGRRHFLGSLAAAMATPAFCQTSKPQRRELLLRNGYVMTMDPELGEIAGGDVHIRDGQIAAVGKNISAPRATVIDGQGTIVLPGLVDTHWHMWNTLLRSFAGDTPDQGYFATAATFGQVMTPEDMYHSTLLGAAEALHSGITTVHNFCHNVRSLQHAEADIRALQEAGLRARWSYGWPQGLADTQVSNLADLETLKRDWAKFANDGLLRWVLPGAACFATQHYPRKSIEPSSTPRGAWACPFPRILAAPKSTPKDKSPRTPKKICWAKTCRLFMRCPRHPPKSK